MNRCFEKLSLHPCNSPSHPGTRWHNGNRTHIGLNSLLTGAQCSLTKLTSVLLCQPVHNTIQTVWVMEEWNKLWRVSFNYFLYRTPMCINWHHHWNRSSQDHVGAKPVVNTDSDSPWFCSLWCEKFNFYVLMSFDGLLLAVSEYSKCYLINDFQCRLRRKTLWAHLSINTEVRQTRIFAYPFGDFFFL